MGIYPLFGLGGCMERFSNDPVYAIFQAKVHGGVKHVADECLKINVVSDWLCAV